MTHTNLNSFPYTKKHMIGSGGTAVVYLAEDHTTGTDVAIKMISKSVSGEQKFRARFEREIAMLQSVSHPNILPVINHGETDGQLYMVMPFVSGGSVRDLLEKGPISWEQTVSIMEQVCPALDAMHEMGFIHRDIKPHNILLGQDGDVMLSDFGISRPIEETQDSSVTHTLDIVGTPGFIAPEQAAKGELSAQTDIYQLGVTTFYMLTGERLFEGSTLEVIAKHIGEKPGSAGDLVDGLPRNIDAVLHMALAKDPQDRFRSASDFLGALNLLSDQNTVTFQHLPGFPVRATAPAAGVTASDADVPASDADVPAEPVYEAVIPAANGRGFSASAQASAQSTITPSAAPAAKSRKRLPFIRYAVAGFSIVALILGGIFFIPGALDGGNGGGGRGNGGNGNGGRGGQGNATDNAPTLVEDGDSGVLNAAVALDSADNSENLIVVDQVEAELPTLANDAEEAVQIVSAIVDEPVAQAPVINNETDNSDPDPIPVTNPIVDTEDDAPTDADNDGNGNNGGRNGNGGQGGNGNDGNGDGDNNNNNGNGNGGRGNGNDGNNGNGGGRGNGNGGRNGNGGGGGN